MNARIATFAPLLLLGCGADSPGPVAASLATSSIVTTHGARPRSRVTAHRRGPLDPDGSDLDLEVRDVRLRIRAGERTVQAEQLELVLGDVDLPPSKALPEGLKLRAQRLVAAGRPRAEVLRRSADALDVRLTGMLQYHASMVLSDGSLYALGPSDSEEGASLEVHVARGGGTAGVILESAPAGTCGSIADLLTLSECTLFAEADGTIAPAP